MFSLCNVLLSLNSNSSLLLALTRLHQIDLMRLIRNLLCENPKNQDLLLEFLFHIKSALGKNEKFEAEACNLHLVLLSVA